MPATNAGLKSANFAQFFTLLESLGVKVGLCRLFFVLSQGLTVPVSLQGTFYLYLLPQVGPQV